MYKCTLNQLIQWLLFYVTGGIEGGRFINRKGFFALNVQMITDAKMVVINIVARWPGSTHDSRIFANSRLNDYLANMQHRGYLVGDSGYPCLPYLMTPLRNPKTDPERRYNRAHARTRNVVERTYGLMKRRFPCLLHLRSKLENSKAVIVAVAILQNVAILNRDPQPEDEDDGNNDNGDEDDDDQDGMQDNRNGMIIRRNLIAAH